ncbi:GNAT family N-acetyltransferase [Dactylosporangium sp. CA-052675]|uniref:GNAT family N-acetyltransferase n=1 Tax=Dactylosporangium sp. CA-052675 TaxID=3239927 RepID=UPI003D914292
MSEVLLRDLVEADLEVLYEQQREEEAVRRAQFPARDREPFMTHWRTKVLADSANHVQIVVAGGAVAGSVMAWWRDDRRFIGYWLGQRFWGRGIGTAALRLFLRRERIRPLFADTFAGNTASVKLLQRCGFRQVGTEHEGDLEFVVLMLADGAPPAAVDDAAGAAPATTE